MAHGGFQDYLEFGLLGYFKGKHPVFVGFPFQERISLGIENDHQGTLDPLAAAEFAPGVNRITVNPGKDSDLVSKCGLVGKSCPQDRNKNKTNNF